MLFPTWLGNNVHAVSTTRICRTWLPTSYHHRYLLDNLSKLYTNKFKVRLECQYNLNLVYWDLQFNKEYSISNFHLPEVSTYLSRSRSPVKVLLKDMTTLKLLSLQPRPEEDKAHGWDLRRPARRSNRAWMLRCSRRRFSRCP